MTPPYSLRAVAKVRQPTFVAAAPGEPGRLYIVERRGSVRMLQNGRLAVAPFLDLSRGVGVAGERGLLSIAFHPKYQSNRLVYAFYTDREGTINVTELRVAGGRADPATARVLVRVEHDASLYHNGGQLAFGPDGRLYAGVGDGGYLFQEPDPNGNSQNTAVLLGKIFRIDVDDREARPELVAYGLRNPWRFSFDASGDLIVGDVGWKSFEELDVVRAGTTGVVNFGWSVYEGRRRRSTVVQLNPEGVLTPPIHTYATNVSGNCSITAGYVYRGRRIPSLRGRYVFGDFCSGRIWSARYAAGRLSGLRVEPVRAKMLSSFGVDASGELYASTLGGAVYRFTPR